MKHCELGRGMNVAILRPGGFLDSFQVFDTHAEGIGSKGNYRLQLSMHRMGLVENKGMTAPKCQSFAGLFVVKCWNKMSGCTILK